MPHVKLYIPTGVLLIAASFYGQLFIPNNTTNVDGGRIEYSFESNQNEKNEDFREQIVKLNGDIFWAPASRDLDKSITVAGDEIRSVFGEAPDESFNCASEEAVPIHIEVDGNQVKLKHDVVSGRMRFQHCPPGAYTPNQCKWTDKIEKCDKPSLAGNVNFCGTASRIVKRSIGPVDWMLLCRKSTKGHAETSNGPRATHLYADDYWREDNPTFRLYGLIIYNNISGEVSFIDGDTRDITQGYNWHDPFVPPGGYNYNDEALRAKAEAFYDSEFKVGCHQCHDNKNPWTITPHLNQDHVGYNSLVREHAFANTIIPKITSSLDNPYRIIGTGYTKANCKHEYNEKCKGLAFAGKHTEECTKCHTLTTLNTGNMIAYDSVSRSNTRYSYGDLGENYWAELSAVKTEWSKSHISPWMNGFHSRVDDTFLDKIDSTWRSITKCARNRSLSFLQENDCEFKHIFNECPIPGGELDPASIENYRITKLRNHSVNINGKILYELNWNYLNNYGDIPTRDDVRFELQLASSKRGQKSEKKISNISYEGHEKWSVPAASISGRNYKLVVPIQCDVETTLTITPIRHCFEAQKASVSGPSTSLTVTSPCKQ